MLLGAKGWPTSNSVMQSRLTAIMRREDGWWKLVHLHHTVGVPKVEVVELQQRWAAEGFSEPR